MCEPREPADDSMPEWAQQTIQSFVSLAHLQPGSSVLCIGTNGVDQLVISVRETLKAEHGMIVGVEASPELLDEARIRLKSVGGENEITLHCGDITRLHVIDDLRSLRGQGQSTFDVILAWNAFDRVQPKDRVRTLEHCATYLTPGTGHMVITLGTYVNGLQDTAGVFAVDDRGNPLVCMNVMLESEWALGMQDLRTLVTAAGLKLGRTQRVGHNGEASLQWQDQADIYHQHLKSRHSMELMEFSDPDSHWTNPDGTFSRFFKWQMKYQLADEMWADMKKGNQLRPEGSVCLTRFLGMVAGVVNQ